jgi:hypothetical protein
MRNALKVERMQTDAHHAVRFFAPDPDAQLINFLRTTRRPIGASACILAKLPPP